MPEIKRWGASSRSTRVFKNMSELGYFLAGFFVGITLGFHIACSTIKKLIKNEPEKMLKIFTKQ